MKKEESYLNKIKIKFLLWCNNDLNGFCNYAKARDLSYIDIKNLLNLIKENPKDIDYIFKNLDYKEDLNQIVELIKLCNDYSKIKVLVKILQKKIECKDIIKFFQDLEQFEFKNISIYSALDDYCILRQYSLNEIINLLKVSLNNTKTLNFILNNDDFNYEQLISLIKLFNKYQDEQIWNFTNKALNAWEYNRSEIPKIIEILINHHFNTSISDLISVADKNFQIKYSVEEIGELANLLEEYDYNDFIYNFIYNFIDYKIPISYKKQIIKELKDENIDVITKILNSGKNKIFFNTENKNRDLAIVHYILKQDDYENITELAVSLNYFELPEEKIKILIDLYRMNNYQPTILKCLTNRIIWQYRTYEDIMEYILILKKNGYNEGLLNIIYNQAFLENLSVEDHKKIINKYIDCEYNEILFKKVKMILIARYENNLQDIIDESKNLLMKSKYNL